jgi:antitoxin component of MazEF toxin-antitoxin module
MGENEILDVGEVRKFTNSLYFLIPRKVTEKLNVMRGARFQITVNEDCLTNTYTVTYHLKKEGGTAPGSA